MCSSDLLLVTLTGCLLLLAAGLYPVYAFLPIWPAGTSMPAQALYRPSWSDSRFGGNFGFPHQDGFKAVALLQDLGYVPGPYDSNTTAEVTRWYLPSAERCDRPRGSYVTAFSDRRTDSRLPGSDIWVITVRGAPRTIVRDQTTPGRPLAQLAAEAPTEWFDTQLARLDRPLTIPQVRCARSEMGPARGGNCSAHALAPGAPPS